MGFTSDLIEGSTELPRIIIGGIATSLGADSAATKSYLGLSDDSDTLRSKATSLADEDPKGLLDMIEANPGKFIGEIIPYVFLPTRLFGKARHINYANKLRKKKSSNIRLKAKGYDIAHQSASIGTYGAIEETASSSLNDRDSATLERFTTDAVFTIAAFGVFNAARKATGMIKNEAAKNKYTKDFLLDMGIPPKEVKAYVKMSPKDKEDHIASLTLGKDNAVNAIIAASRSSQVSAKLSHKSAMKEGEPDVHTRITKSIDKLGYTSHNQRPSIKIKKDSISKLARAPVEVIRKASDDMDSHLRQLDRHANGLKIKILESIPSPDARVRITNALDVDGDISKLNAQERAAAVVIRDTFDELGSELLSAGIIKSWRASYVPHILNHSGMDDGDGMLADLLESVGKRTKTSAFSERGLQRKDLSPLRDKDAKSMDIADLVQLYTLNVGRAIAMKNVLSHLDEDMFSSAPRQGWGEITRKSHPSIVSAISSSGKKVVKDSLYVHPDYKPSIDLIGEHMDLPAIAKAVIFTNFASKRALIMGSLFHFNALAESSIFAGAAGIGAISKGAGAGFLISGGNPLGAAVGAGIGAGVHVVIGTKNIAAQMRGGKFGDQYDFILRYVDIRPPRDVGNDEFYSGLSSVQRMIDKYVPTNTARGVLKKGTKAVRGVNKAIDILMWHRLLGGAKSQVFMANLERLSIKNLDLPLKERRSQHELATIAGQFTNDAFGGQNWRKLAEGVDNAFGRRIAAAMAKPLGMQWANLIMFAPDWTLSNIRILAKAFPGINNDPISRGMYQRYATRAAIYYMIVGSAVQMAMTGKPIFMNEDPTKIDLGDGRSMTFSKQLMEPFQWAADPLHEAHMKTSSLVKGIEEQVTNKHYPSSRAPKIVSDSDTALEAVGNRLKVAGNHFAPIFVQDITENGPQGIYGFFGHPVYGSIRHGFKTSNGYLDTREQE